MFICSVFVDFIHIVLLFVVAECSFPSRPAISLKDTEFFYSFLLLLIFSLTIF